MSTGVGRTEIIAGPFETREQARELEEPIQNFLNGIVEAGGQPEGAQESVYQGIHIPVWARGVRVEDNAKEGETNQYVLVATEDAR